MAKTEPIIPRTAGRYVVAIDEDTWKLANVIATVNAMNRKAQPQKYADAPATQGEVVARALEHYADELRADRTWRAIFKTMLEQEG